MKIDFKKALDCYGARHREFRIVEVPPLQYLMVDGHTTTMFEDAIAVTARKLSPGKLDTIRIETLHEGRCVQTLHIGPYDDEADLLAHPSAAGSFRQLS